VAQETNTVTASAHDKASTERSASNGSPAWLIWTFAATTLISAFLLFQVQPLISKFILPWFGGVPAVWTTCMLFFQVLLFAGYTYAHLSERWLSPRRQALLQVALLVAAAVVALWLVPPSGAWKPEQSDAPTWRILLLLGATVGLPYLVLSTTSPLVQVWFSRSYPGRSPYRLYALSNFGSLVALLSYPFVFEPAFGLLTQSRLWSWAFVLYVLACGVCAAWMWRMSGRLPAVASPAEAESPLAACPAIAPSWWRRAAWLLLPACASLMLLATTNHVCQDMAVVPFLWVVPLTLYLLTFIICFDHSRWYVRGLWAVLAAAAVLAVAGSNDIQTWIGDLLHRDFSLNYVEDLVLHFAAMFFICMVCHGELVRLRPDPKHLTEFYLMISAGGALGGVAVSLIAPHVFTTFFEWKIGMAVSYMLAVVVLALAAGRGAAHLFGESAREPKTAGKPAFSAALGLVLLVGLGGLAALLYWQRDTSRTIVERIRNFYGVISVQKYAPADKPVEDHLYIMRHGAITHGEQYIVPGKRRLALTYYAESTAVGRAIRNIQTRKPTMRVGLVGLGVGTLATYARQGDQYTFYEINPEVWRLADAENWRQAHPEDRRETKTYFTYLQDARQRKAAVDVVLGDARLSLEQELNSNASRQFDVLVLDAFSGDSVPTHLLTKEAFAIYRAHLAPDGAIAVHVTNTYLHLAPVVRGLADDAGLKYVGRYMRSNEDPYAYRNHWMILSNDAVLLKAIPAKAPPPELADDFDVPLWTDHYSNLFQILRWR
jgi:hypothetical protein